MRSLNWYTAALLLLVWPNSHLHANMPRSAAKVTPSFEQHVNQLHRKADDLEKQLQGNKGDERVGRLRLPLCETMADVMLADPKSSAEKDVAGRLWRICFYQRILLIRTKKQKEQRRGNDTSRIEASFNEFLREGVTLYDFLINRLRRKLEKKAGMEVEEDSTTAGSQGSISTTHVPPPSLITDGVVALLATCYVSLGDLFRYSENLEQAETAYQMASRLAPGFGHAFNQLAVVCQLKEKQGSPLSAVALYWYARSLLVTVDPFTTAKANLARLLASNHEWLKNQTDTKDRSKSAQTRRFLGMFVDLHFHLFQGISVASYSDVMDQIDTVMGRFRSLLEISAFGDALLCRLVVIHTFSECYLDRPNGSPSALTMVMARVATYRLGICLAERVMVGLNKVAEGKMPSSVRLLLPVLLVAEYTASLTMPPTDNTDASETLEHARRTFWGGMIALWNKVDGMVSSDTMAAANEELKAFLDLRGFGPFGFLPSCENGLLSDEDALHELLQVGKKEKHNETASTSTSGGTSTDQGRFKLARLLKLADKLVKDKEGAVGRHIDKDDEGIIAWIEGGCEEKEENADDFSVPMEVEPEDENVLVYKSGSDGGPALLVPGMLLQPEATDDGAETTIPLKKSAMSPDNQDQSVASDKLPVFDATPANLQDIENPLAFPQPTEPVMGNATTGSAFGNSNSKMRTPPGLEPPSGSLPPPPGFTSSALAPPGQPETIGEALRLYGNQMQTSNPFAPPGLSNAFPYSAPPAAGGPNFLGDNEGNGDPMSVEGSSLLGSGLLNSLWMDDSTGKTKNPFAT